MKLILLKILILLFYINSGYCDLVTFRFSFTNYFSNTPFIKVQLFSRNYLVKTFQTPLINTALTDIIKIDSAYLSAHTIIVVKMFFNEHPLSDIFCTENVGYIIHVEQNPSGIFQLLLNPPNAPILYNDSLDVAFQYNEETQEYDILSNGREHPE